MMIYRHTPIALMFILSGLLSSCSDTQPPSPLPTVNRLPGPCTETTFDLDDQITAQKNYQYNEAHCVVSIDHIDNVFNNSFAERMICNADLKPTAIVFDFGIDEILDGVKQLDYDEMGSVIEVREGPCLIQSFEECLIQETSCVDQNIYEYNTEGQVLRKTIDEGCNGTADGEEFFEYIKQGNMQIIIYTSDISGLDMELDGIADMTHRQVFVNEQLTEETIDLDGDSVPDFKQTYSYNNFGDVVLLQNIDLKTNSVTSSQRSQYEYDTDVNIVQRIDFDASGSVSRRIEFDYSCWR